MVRVTFCLLLRHKIGGKKNSTTVPKGRLRTGTENTEKRDELNRRDAEDAEGCNPFSGAGFFMILTPNPLSMT
jgi:hypothetical protein